ncbi:acyltransferase family protein [Spirosoma aerophilum]
MGYLKPIDAIRAMAVLLIIASHWIDASSLSRQLGLDSIGVNTLFVISGFLITNILFNQREKTWPYGSPSVKVLLKFYARRALRIFPIYYLLIIALLVYYFQKTHTITADFYYYLTYTSNFYFYSKHVFEAPIPNVWTLAVGAQFYLIWPWLMLSFNKKYLLGIILGFILCGVVTQFLFRSIPLGHLLPFTCFDCFGMGALLSWVVVYNPNLINKFYKRVTIAALISVCLYVWFMYQDLWEITILRTCAGIIALWILTYLVVNHTKRSVLVDTILYNPFLLFLGKISYGLYLYHLIIPLLIENDFFWLTINVNLPDVFLSHLNWINFFESAILLLLISVLSYFLVEKPFSSVKKYFSLNQSSKAYNQMV